MMMFGIGGYGKFMVFVNPSQRMCIRNCLSKFHQDGAKDTTKHVHKTELPLKPKKPLNAFFMYMEKVRSEFMKENPNLKCAEVVRKLSQQWAKLDSAEKESLQKEFMKNYEIYIKNLREYIDSLTEEQKKLFLQSQKRYSRKHEVDTRIKKPKRPPSSFLLYLKSHIATKDPSVTFQNWVQMMTKNWYQMSPAEKQQYADQFAELLEQYHQAIKKWEVEMEKLGHMDVVRHSSKSSSC